MVNSLNQVTNDGTCSYSYDANGNLTTKSWANGALYYTWDDENQLVRVQTDTYYTPEAYRWRTDFGYDSPASSRPAKRADFAVASSGNVPTVSYTRGIDLSGSFEGAGGIGGLLGRSHGYASGSWSTHNFYHADGNHRSRGTGGNVTYMINSSQGMAATYRYDPFGRTTSSSGALASANLYRFSSKPIHANSGLYYYGYRFCWPEWQSWINRDPLQEEGEDQNLYRAMLNNPIGALDANGLSPSLNPQNICWAGEALEAAGLGLASCRPVPVPVPVSICMSASTWAYPETESDCPPEKLAALTEAVNQACRQSEPRACHYGDSPEELRGKIAHAKKCLRARRLREVTCFRGGNDGHRHQMHQLLSLIDYCKKRLRTDYEQY
jgi:RHS repeat-associated protein